MIFEFTRVNLPKSQNAGYSYLVFSLLVDFVVPKPSACLKRPAIDINFVPRECWVSIVERWFTGGRSLKRVFPQESVADSHSLISNGIQSGALGGSRRVQTSVAMLGIAFSFGTSAPLLVEPESALAAEGSVVAVLPAAGDEADVVQPKFVTDTGDLAATTYHTVQEGDSLWHIAEEHQADVRSIKSANGIAPDEVLRVGQVIRVPSVIAGVDANAQSEKVQRLALSNNVRGSVGGDLSVVFGEELPLDSQGEAAPAPESSTVAKLDAAPSSGLAAEDAADESYELTAATLTGNSPNDSEEVDSAKAALANLEAAEGAPETVETVAVLPAPLPTSMPLNEVKVNPLSELNAVDSASEAPLAAAPVEQVAEPLAATAEPEVAASPAVAADGWQNQDLQAPVSEQPTAVATDKSLTVAALNNSANEAAETVLNAAPEVDAQRYQVKAGDTLWDIASRHGLSVDELMHHNAGQQAESLMVGDQINIPQPQAYDADQSSESPLARAIIPTAEQNRDAAIQDHLARIRAAANQQIDQEELKARITAVRQSLEASERQQMNVAPLEFHSPVDETPAAVGSQAELDTSSISSEQRQRLPLGTAAADQPTWTVTDAAAGEGSTDLAALTSPTETTNGLLDSAPAQPAVPENMMAAAPMSPDTYRASPQLPVGEVVNPGMPMLPDSGEFLPEAPNRFNGYVWPARGTLTSGYGWRWGRMHRGIDIAGPVGTPIMAAAPGVVVRSGWNSGGYGNLVDIRHADGSLTRYAHNSRLLVREGQQVRQGQQIAEMGSTGFSTGPHLHFEVHLPNSGTVNPLAHLPGR